MLEWYQKKQVTGMRIQIVIDEVKVLNYLASTDWYVVRKAETGVDIPQDVLDKRGLCRGFLSA